ncbi:MAG TPA: DUF748 domain-containing protein [Bacteroidia bacterium]|nr:DUF748 domain-containing protein [Bacteroidia bacterium]
MKKVWVRSRKIAVITLCTVVLLMGLILLFISPITKYLIEKYDVEYTGREITLDYAYVNPFTGYVFLRNLEIKEPGSDSVFLSCYGTSAHFNLRKFFSNTCEISDISFDKLQGTIGQVGNKLNFSDLITRFASQGGPPSAHPFHFNMLHIVISNGTLSYKDPSIPINYKVVEVNIDSPGIKWDMDSLNARIALVSGSGGGSIHGNFTMNYNSLEYKLDAIISKLNLGFFEQYFKTMSNYGSFRASLDANLKTKGNFNDAEDINAKGLMVINDFHFGVNAKNDFASFETFTLQVDSLNPAKKQYVLDSISLVRPFFKFELYDSLDNVQTMFGASGAKAAAAAGSQAKFNLIIEIGDYIKALARNFFRSDYKVNRLAIYKGDFRYNDYSPGEKFSIASNPVTVLADSIAKSKNRVNLYFTSGIQPYGNASVQLSINPKDSADFDLHYNFQKMSLALFNPYLIKYTSFPLDRGTLELNGNWVVRNGVIQSTNHILVVDPRVNSRIRNSNNKWIPMRLIMFFLREKGNVIDYQIPISGNLKDPRFHWKDVVLNIVRNIFIKPVTAPYRTRVKQTEKEIENSLSLKWVLGQNYLYPHQIRFLEKLAAHMQDDPSLHISVYPLTYLDKEREHILLFEARKKYFLFQQHRTVQSLTKKDSLTICFLSVKDSLFTRYLRKTVGKQMLFTIQDQCLALLGTEFVRLKLDALLASRRMSFCTVFKKTDLLNRVSLRQEEDKIPYNGFSYFRIAYTGDLPERLATAYIRMKELDQESPRDKFTLKRLREREKE